MKIYYNDDMVYMKANMRILSKKIAEIGFKMEMLWKIKKSLEENGIEIPFSQRTVWFANGLRKQEIS